VGVIAKAAWRFVFLCILAAGTALAQTPSLQDLQNQLLQFEESTQKTIAALRAQIAALQQAQRPPAAVPPAPSVPPPAPAAAQTSEVPVVHFPVEYYGTETRNRDTAGENEIGAPRIDNEPLDPKLRGFFRLPGTNTYMKFGGFVKTDLFYDLNWAGTYYGASLLSKTILNCRSIC
jgi:hypothetical protein